MTNPEPYGQEAAGKDRPRPWLRLFAFLFDTLLLTAPIKFVLFLYSPDLYTNFVFGFFSLGGSLMMIVTSLPLMAFTTRTWGTTAGKALLGCSVSRADGGKVAFTAAYKRTVTSFVVGTAMMILNEFTVLALFLCYRGIKLRGGTFWDSKYRTKVSYTAPRPAAVAAFVCLFAGLLFLDRYPLLVTVYKPLVDEFLKLLESYSSGAAVQSIGAALSVMLS
ncbi:MAG: RDD family protein [Oscillospiraceae bacterium]|nr:RDD family protein [Oscillospiraceae bacterium]